LELLVVIAIIGIVTALLFTAVQRVRESANQMTCANNLRQLALGVHNYERMMRKLPYGTYHGPYGAGPNSFAWSWLARLLPYVEQENLYRQGRVGDSRLEQSGIAGVEVALFICPSDAAGNGPRMDAGDLAGFAIGQTNYKAVSGSNWGADLLDNKPVIATDWRHQGANQSFDGLSEGDGMMFRTDYLRGLSLTMVMDGTSNTFMIGEDVPAKDQWCSWPYANNAYGTCAIPPNVRAPSGGEYDPSDWQNTFGFRSRHPGGLHFAMADGSVHFVSDSISLDIYRALATIQGGEVATLP